MKCRKCNATIQKGAEYCDQCGTKMELNNRKIDPIKIVIAIVIIFAVAVALKTGIQLIQYSGYLKSAKESAQEKEYIDALVYCGMASHIKPQKEEPYLKMADYYMERSESNQAFAILNIGKIQAKEQEKISAKQEEIKSFADEDVMTKEIILPEYTETKVLRRKKAAKDLMQELKEYYGIDNSEYGEIAQYYKGYYYFIEENTIYRTEQDEKTCEPIYSVNEENNISALKIANNKIYFCYGVPGTLKYSIASIELTGIDLKVYDWSLGDLAKGFFVKQGWLYYHYIEGSVIGYVRMSMQGEKREFLAEKNSDLLRIGYYYSVNEKKQIKKVSIKNNRKNEEIVCVPDGMPENDAEAYIYVCDVYNPRYIVYEIIWRDENNEKAALYQYDLEKKKEIKLEQINGKYGLIQTSGDWIYVTSSSNDYSDILYRININDHKKEIIAESEYYYERFIFCKNKIIAKVPDDNLGENVVFLETDDLKANQKKMSELKE